jgi:hypothetical protein
VKEAIVKKLLILTLALCVVQITTAQVELKVFEADGITPFDGHDIMVGSKLTLIVSSDSDNYWSGGLFIAGADRALATLSARDSDPNIRDYTDSHYEDAGDMARVTSWKDSDIWGFDLYGSDINAVAGDWFVIDYKATGVGDPNIGFYDYSNSWDEPNLLLTFHHDPTRDFNRDEKVDISDYAILASWWLDEDCNEPNWCGGTDINRDSWVDMVDFVLFEKYWQWGVPSGEESSYPDGPADPNIIFSIVDANGLDEITMNVGESITLYIDMLTLEANTILFDLEVNISDPNLGSIDNTAYDPCDPPGAGTARILAEPRDVEYDGWGPGFQQEEGIRLHAISIFDPIWDGHMASFVYTSNGQGDVTLDLIDWNSSGTAGLEGILIHQLDPYSQQMMSGGMGAAEASLFLEPVEPVEPIENTTVEDLVEWLEQLWLNDKEVRKTFSEDEWNEFVDSIGDLL